MQKLGGKLESLEETLPPALPPTRYWEYLPSQ